MNKIKCNYKDKKIVFKGHSRILNLKFCYNKQGKWFKNFNKILFYFIKIKTKLHL